MEGNEEKDVNQSVEELLQMFIELKQVFKEEVEEKEKLKQKLDFIENNSEWSKGYVNHLRQQITQYQTYIDSQQNSLNQFKQIKETNTELNERITSLNELIQRNEVSKLELIDKIKLELNSEIEELNKCLSSKEKEIQDLKLIIESKDILLNQSKRELSDNEKKNKENIEEIKDFYEKRIESLHKEFDDKYQKIQRVNDEKIIEIRANCMRSVDKTKDEYESKLYKIESENKELKENYSHLKLECEALKMNSKSDNSKTLKNIKVSLQSHKTRPQNKTKLKLQFLDSDEELNESVLKIGNHSNSKRKKLHQMSESFKEYIRDES